VPSFLARNLAKFLTRNLTKSFLVGLVVAWWSLIPAQGGGLGGGGTVPPSSAPPLQRPGYTEEISPTPVPGGDDSIVGLFGLASRPASPPELNAGPPGVRLLRADPTGLTIEWVVPSVWVRPLDDGTVNVVADGCAQMGQPGLPRLPFSSALVALPPGVSPHLRILSVEETALPLPAPVALAPWPEGVVRDEGGRPVGGDFVSHAKSGEIPAGGGGWSAPRAPAALEEIGVARGVRLARLVLYPALPEGETLRVVRRLHVEVSWEMSAYSSPGPLTPYSPAPGGLESPSYNRKMAPPWGPVRWAVLNPWDAVAAPHSESENRRVGESANLTQNLAEALIEVPSSGLYRVTYEDLENLGFGGTDPSNLRLFQGGNEVACEWEGDGDALFEPGEALLFYAEPRFSRWTDVDVYRLVADVVPGLRMTARSADPSGLTAGIPWVERLAEENHIYTPDCFCAPIPPGRDGDRWVWELLRRPDLLTVTLPFQTPAVEEGQPAMLTLWLVSYTAVSADPDHRVDVALNGVPLGLVEWDGKAAITATLPIPAGALQSGDNVLTLALPGVVGVEVEGTWLDGFVVRHARSAVAVGAWLGFEGEVERRAYTVGLAGTARAGSLARAYDVTDPLHPQRLTGVRVDGEAVTLGDPPGGGPRRYIVAGAYGILRPASVRAPEDAWSLLPSVGQAFQPAPLPSAGLDNRGLRDVAGADVLIITHPDFADALTPLVNLRQSQGLSVAVANVMGIYDVWGDGRPAPEVIRAFIADAYDTWDPRPAYVLLVGDGSFDPRRYQSDSPPTFIPPYLADVDPWAGEVAADNRYACVDGEDALPDLELGRLPVQTAEEARAVVDKIIRYESEPLPGGWNTNVLLVADDTDKAGDFVAYSEAHAAIHVMSPFTVTRRYCMGLVPGEDDCPAQDADALHAALLNDWNHGALVVQFTGHASWHQWATERFFHLDDLAGLHNGPRLPVVVDMTCFTGAFQRPEMTLDESLLRLDGGGGVAAWGPTGLGVGTGHAWLSDGFFQAVFADGVETVGEATLMGKLALAASGQNLDLLDTFTLLGDPATHWNLTVVPWADEAFLPIALRGN